MTFHIFKIKIKNKKILRNFDIVVHVSVSAERCDNAKLLKGINYKTGLCGTLSESVIGQLTFTTCANKLAIQFKTDNTPQSNRGFSMQISQYPWTNPYGAPDCDPDLNGLLAGGKNLLNSESFHLQTVIRLLDYGNFLLWVLWKKYFLWFWSWTVLKNFTEMKRKQYLKRRNDKTKTEQTKWLFVSYFMLNLAWISQ